jgi:hypothetical protein
MSLVILALAASASLNFTKISWPKIDDGAYELLTSTDVDGDGTADEAVVSLTCASGKLVSSSIVTAREAGSGMATGKRQHAPVTFVKEWSAVPAEVAKVRAQWDLKSQTKRMIAPAAGGARPIDLDGGDALCTALRAHRTRSNIQNN